MMAHLRIMHRSDLPGIGALLVKAFSQGRIDDGYESSHVPPCRIEFLEMYLSQCPHGCFVLEQAGQILAASFCHVWGKTGWIGPLAVIPEKHLSGLGKQITAHCIDFFKQSGCTTIGLETSPRSYRNLGFYGKLGFLPTTLTIDMMRDVDLTLNNPMPANYEIKFYSKCTNAEREEFCRKVLAVTKSVVRNVDYSPLILANQEFNWGDSILLEHKKEPVGYVSTQSESSSAEERQSILRTLALVVSPKASYQGFTDLICILENIAREGFFEHLLIRVPTQCTRTFQVLLSQGFRVLHSDLRMTLESFPEPVKADCIHLSRWE